MPLVTPIVLLLSLAVAPAASPVPAVLPAPTSVEVAPPPRPDSTLAHRLHRAFVKGDASLATAEAAPRLHVTIQGEGGRYSRAQAAFVLEAFFREHPPARVTLSMSGVAEGARSLMGRYVSEDGLAFRLGVRLRQKGGDWHVIGIDVEPAPSEVDRGDG